MGRGGAGRGRRVLGAAESLAHRDGDVDGGGPCSLGSQPSCWTLFAILFAKHEIAYSQKKKIETLDGKIRLEKNKGSVGWWLGK